MSKAPAPAPKQAKVLYVGCVPMKGSSSFPVSATEALAPMIQELCESFNVPHLAVVDYGKGWSALAATLADRGWPTNVSAIYLDPISKEYEHVASVLSAQADVVIKRVGNSFLLRRNASSSSLSRSRSTPRTPLKSTQEPMLTRPTRRR